MPSGRQRAKRATILGDEDIGRAVSAFGENLIGDGAGPAIEDLGFNASIFSELGENRTDQAFVPAGIYRQDIIAQ